MKAYQWPLETALNYVKEKRNCITPNRGFMEQLKTYQGILDASRNRNSELWNQLKLTPSEPPELVPWQGLSEDGSNKSGKLVENYRLQLILIICIFYFRRCRATECRLFGKN